MFSKDTDFIKRVLNFVLVIWLMAVVIITYNSAVNLVFDYPQNTYSEYKTLYCGEEDDCESRYKAELAMEERQRHSNIKTLINSTGNAVIIGCFMFGFNRKSSIFCKKK